MVIRLTKKGFRFWLFDNRRVIVGIADKPNACPFCCYLKSRGAKRVRIMIAHRTVDGLVHQHNEWQRAFQHAAIDMERELDVRGLRGREALAVLDGLD